MNYPRNPLGDLLNRQSALDKLDSQKEFTKPSAAAEYPNPLAEPHFKSKKERVPKDEKISNNVLSILLTHDSPVRDEFEYFFEVEKKSAATDTDKRIEQNVDELANFAWNDVWGTVEPVEMGFEFTGDN